MNDLINRQDIEWHDYYIADGNGMYHNEKIAYKSQIDDLPSAQQWIPCSERLPDEARHYLCSFKKPNRIDRIYVDLAYWTGGRWHGYVADAINAWMSLPEPYKDGE